MLCRIEEANCISEWPAAAVGVFPNAFSVTAATADVDAVDRMLV